MPMPLLVLLLLPLLLLVWPLLPLDDVSDRDGGQSSKSCFCCFVRSSVPSFFRLS